VAQYDLGCYYNKLDSDFWAEAYAWFSLAAAHGHESAYNECMRLEVKMTSEMLDNGRALRDSYLSAITKAGFKKSSPRNKPAVTIVDFTKAIGRLKKKK